MAKRDARKQSPASQSAKSDAARKLLAVCHEILAQSGRPYPWGRVGRYLIGPDAMLGFDSKLIAQLESLSEEMGLGYSPIRLSHESSPPEADGFVAKQWITFAFPDNSHTERHCIMSVNCPADGPVTEKEHVDEHGQTEYRREWKGKGKIVASVRPAELRTKLCDVVRRWVRWLEQQGERTLSAQTSPSAAKPLGNGESGFKGGTDLADALGVHESRRNAFFQELMRSRMGLPGDCWCEVESRQSRMPRFLYRVDSPELRQLAVRYSEPKRT